MDPLFRLEHMLSDFSFLFKSNNFNHFRTFVKGLIMTPHRGTMTQIYLSTAQKTTYWALAKFLSRSPYALVSSEISDTRIDDCLFATLFPTTLFFCE